MRPPVRPGPASALLVRLFTIQGRRPNLLIRCPGAESRRLRRLLMRSCEPPVHVCRLPGRLALPSHTVGTLLLENVTALALAQQIRLQDWMSHGSQPQVISVVFAPLYPMVERGEFLEGLFYRLNVVTLEAELN
jgi:hypothetical protein